VDDLISLLRDSGYGMYINKLFACCILYADDILLLSSSCHGLQSMLHICNECGKKWDIHFSPVKTQCVTFGGQAPRQFNLVIGGNSLTRSSKPKYLGCTIKSGSCELDISPAVGKFYSQFNNIMAVLGKQKNEMAAVHLMKSYCLSSLLYACEIWSSKVSSVHSANVALNNSFRRIFNCCWRENPKMLLFYCCALPIVHNVDQRRILFYKS